MELPEVGCCGGGGGYYNGSTAATYADYWWNGVDYGEGFTYFGSPIGGDDCTNFVSQALWWGGMPFIGWHNFNDQSWWFDSSYNGTAQKAWSPSWPSVVDQENYLAYDNPGGTLEYIWGPSQRNNTYTPSNIVTGDIVVYSWAGNDAGDHEALQVGWGTDPSSGWYGNYVDTHTNDRYHAFWSLVPYNSQASSTTYRLWHIWADN